MEVILHPGMHKTGTSSIQSALRGFDDGHTRYVAFKPANHSVPMVTIFDDAPAKYYYHKNRGHSAKEVATIADHDMKVLQSELALGRERLIISGEDISHMSGRALIRMRDFFSAAGLEMRVIFYVRGVHGFASSAAQEWVKHGASRIQFVRPRYRNRFRKFRRNIPPELVEIRSYEDACRGGKSVLVDFLSCLGIDPGQFEDRRANKSLCHHAVLALAKFNAAGVSNRPGLAHVRARQHMIATLGKIFTGAPFRLRQHLIDDGIDVKDLKWMEKVSGFGLATPAAADTPVEPLSDTDELNLILDYTRSEGIQLKDATSSTAALVAMYEQFLKQKKRRLGIL